MSDVAIRVENLGKQYRIGQSEPYHRFSELLGGLVSAPLRHIQKLGQHARGEGANGSRLRRSDTFWALRDVSFEVNKGEVIGIIGRNGAGKSTLLKILSRITEPTTGLAEIRGRIGSLLEVGTGFHPELTGRENIYLNGAILGMTRAEITGKFDEIVAFAEVERFLDTPVKRYSSGMHMRLAFAVAAHLEPEILLVDEVLAVGDLQFTRKCLNRIREIKRSGSTVVFVSHNLPNIRQLCSRVIWLQHGRIQQIGPSYKLCEAYQLQAALLVSAMPNPAVRVRPPHNGRAAPKIAAVEIRDKTGNLCNRFSYGDTLNLIVTVDHPRIQDCAKDYAAVWFLYDQFGRQIAVGSSFPMDSVQFQPTDSTLLCNLGPLTLLPGTYTFRLVLHVPHYENLDELDPAIAFEVVSCDPFSTGYNYPGPFDAAFFLPHRWYRPNSATSFTPAALERNSA